jgi:hypothetical protein
LLEALPADEPVDVDSAAVGDRGGEVGQDGHGGGIRVDEPGGAPARRHRGHERAGQRRIRCQTLAHGAIHAIERSTNGQRVGAPLDQFGQLGRVDAIHTPSLHPAPYP